jgi:ribosomal protein S18 acetylase RimI-like enzyme
MSVPVRHATRADLPTLAQTLAEGFSIDPVMSWVYPSPAEREAQLRAFFDVVLRGSLLRGHVYRHDGGAGAIWAPPDVSVFDRVTAGRLSELMATQFADAARLAFVEAGLAGMSDAHRKAPPHFYLFMMGARHGARGLGLGTALLARVLERCDEEGFPAYLEASSERSRHLYERHGFEVTGTYQFPEGPLVWLMWREPQSQEDG